MTETNLAVESAPTLNLIPNRVLSDATGYVAKAQRKLFAESKKVATRIKQANTKGVEGTAMFVELIVDYCAMFNESDWIGLVKVANQYPIKGDRATEFGELCIDPKTGKARGQSWARHLWNTAKATDCVQVEELAIGQYRINVDRVALGARLRDGDPIHVITKAADKNGKALSGISCRVEMTVGDAPLDSTKGVLAMIDSLEKKLDRYNRKVGEEIAMLKSSLSQ